MAAEVEQLRVGPLLHHLPLVEDNEPIHCGDRRQPVRMAMTVLPAISRCSWLWIAASTSLSSAEVASSSTRIGAFLSNTRAIATRWRWPPESFTPRSPTWAS